MNRKRIMYCLFALMAILAVSQAPAAAQVSATSSLSGSVIDPSGALVPGADVVVHNEGTGEEYKTVTSDNGTFRVPSLVAGTYKVTVQMGGFKTAEVPGVIILAATAAAIKPITLEIGSKNETVVVEAGATVLQTQSAEVATTITGKQITELPFSSRDGLDLVLLLPGTDTPGRPRTSTINGLQQSTLNITIDGVSVQDNTNKSGDGFYTWIRPRIDSVEQVTVSTSTPGAESAGEGAVQIKFVTRGGSNEYHGSLYEYHRNPALAANYWFTNRDNRAPAGADPLTWKAPRDRILLNEPGARIGGPIRLPKKLFGPLGFDGRDRAFFFGNFEAFFLPQKVSTTSNVLNPRTEQGYVRYVVTDPGGTKSIREVNLMDLAASKNQVNTFDPTIKKLLTDIRTAANSTGFINTNDDPYTISDPNTQPYTFTSKQQDKRFFSTARLDFNLTSKHRLENAYNYQRFLVDNFDFFQNGQPRFPNFPNVMMTASNRFSNSTTLRSTLSSKIVNEAQFGLAGGTSCFGQNIGPGDFNGTVANQGGFNIGFPIGTGATVSSSPSRRNGPVKQFTDTLNVIVGSHNVSIGANYTQLNYWSWSQTVVPSISLGVDSTYDPAYAPMFSTAVRAQNFPGATSTSAAASIYALLTGRVTQIGGTSYVGPDGQYQYLGPSVSSGRVRQAGVFVSDTWRVQPNLTITGGLRWDLQMPFVGLNDSFSMITMKDVWGISGVGNLFKPGTLTGSTTTYQAYPQGQALFDTMWKNLAPSVGFAWTPKFEGFLGKLLNERTVLRGGFSVANTRYGTEAYSGILTSTPGRSISATRSQSNLNLVGGTGTDVWPLLFRQNDRLGPPTSVGGVALPKAPTFPNTGTINDGGGTFDPSFRMPYVMSWTLGLQREMTRDTVVEVRYTGNRGLQFQRSTNVNSDNYNQMENGTWTEFWKAQANLYANIAAGKGYTWAYTGVPGTSPLPIAMAYLQGMNGANVNDPTKYTSSQFGLNTTTFDKNSPSPNSYASLFDGQASYRTNALNAGLAANFFLTNPDKRGGTYFTGNGGHSYYDAGTVEVRRRMAKGLLVQASYTIARNFSLVSPALRASWYKRPGQLGGAHAFKADWILEMPFGRGKFLLTDMNPALDHVLGGWEFHGSARLQTGQPLMVSGVRLVGMTRQDLQNAVKLRFDDKNGIVYWLPDNIINNTIAAFNSDITQPSGYSSRWGVPSGQYIAPANGSACAEIYTGQCSNGGFTIRGPMFTRFDLSLVKKVRFTERTNFELRAEFLNAFNYVNFMVGDPGNQTTSTGWGGTSTGRLSSAYRDLSTTNDPGCRTIQIVVRVNF